jgi:hypothetical protein
LANTFPSARDSLQPADLEKSTRTGQRLRPTISLEIEISERKLNFVRIFASFCGSQSLLRDHAGKIAVDAVLGEPLSDRIPVSREKYREFRGFVLKLLAHGGSRSLE